MLENRLESQIRWVRDAQGKIWVLVDPELWEDIQDLLLIQSREQQPDFIPLEEFLEGLEEEENDIPG
ncbi:MAG: hypothetical protein GXO54_03255 [Chloroflexi bacterium]|nr:hypothetical protein [Chloroflexota bacterium]